MERRDFIKQSCSLCMAMAAGYMMSSLASCSPIPVFKTEIAENKIIVPLLPFEQSELQILRPKNFGYDIALRKESDGTYSAILLRCTHADNQLVSTGNGFACNLHGSTFDKKGTVTKGPAEIPLKRFPTELNSDQIIITLT